MSPNAPLCLIQCYICTISAACGTLQVTGVLSWIFWFFCLSSVLVKALDGCPVSNAPLTQITQPVQITVQPSHTEHLQFYVLPHSQPSIIFGLPWLHTHNPVIGEKKSLNLLPGAAPSRAWVYSLSLEESKAMEEYVEEAVRQGFICRSTSPVSAGFFFIEGSTPSWLSILTRSLWSHPQSSSFGVPPFSHDWISTPTT